MISTTISWGLTVGLVVIAVYIYKPELFQSVKSQAQEVKSTINEAASKTNKKAKSKKGASSKVVGEEKAGSVSDGQGSKKRKIVNAQNDKPATGNGSQEQQQIRDEGSGLSDKDFAAQLAQTQSGTNLQVSQKGQPSKKTRRASKLGAVSSPDPSGLSTEDSSTAGRDADDDLTPAESPEARAIDGSVSRAGDISDMLEAPAAKPTTLRLTDVSNDGKAKKSANKAFEPVLSKKKRNEQQRKEEQRLAREESDRIHEAKKQEQLRKARMAAGTSNQTKANNFATTANAWQSGAPSAVKTTPQTNAAEPLLDTFEPIKSRLVHGTVHTQSIEADNANDFRARTGENAAAAMTASARREGLSAEQKREYTSELSEEDQVSLIREQQQDDAWESVTSKKTKKKGKPDNESTSGTSSPVRAAPVPAKTQVNGHKTNGQPKKPEAVNRFESFQVKPENGLQDADWEA